MIYIIKNIQSIPSFLLQNFRISNLPYVLVDYNKLGMSYLRMFLGFSAILVSFYINYNISIEYAIPAASIAGVMSALLMYFDKKIRFFLHKGKLNNYLFTNKQLSKNLENSLLNKSIICLEFLVKYCTLNFLYYFCILSSLWFSFTLNNIQFSKTASLNSFSSIYISAFFAGMISTLFSGSFLSLITFLQKTMLQTTTCSVYKKRIDILSSISVLIVITFSIILNMLNVLGYPYVKQIINVLCILSPLVLILYLLFGKKNIHLLSNFNFKKTMIMETLTITNYNIAATEKKRMLSIFKPKISLKNYQEEKLHNLNFILPKATVFIDKGYDTLFFENYKNLKTPVYHWYGTGRNVLYVQGMNSKTSAWIKTANDLQKNGDNVFVIEAPKRLKEGNSFFNPQLYASYIANFVAKNNIALIITEKEGSYCTTLGLTQQMKAINSVKKIVLLSPVKSYLKLIKKYYKNNASSLKLNSFLQKKMLKNISNSCCDTYNLSNFKAKLNTIEFVEFNSIKSFK